MTSLQERVGALDACRHPSPRRIAELRSARMHAIRFQLAVRLLHAGLREDTLSIFWVHSPRSLDERPLGEGSWRLVLGRGSRIGQELCDLWVLGYPDDAECRRSVEAALDQMVEEARRQSPARVSGRRSVAAAARASAP